MLGSVNDTTNRGPLYIAAAVVNMMCSTRVSAAAPGVSHAQRSAGMFLFPAVPIPVCSNSHSRSYRYSFSFPSDFRIKFPFPSCKNSHIS